MAKSYTLIGLRTEVLKREVFTSKEIKHYRYLGLGTGIMRDIRKERRVEIKSMLRQGKSFTEISSIISAKRPDIYTNRDLFDKHEGSMSERQISNWWRFYRRLRKDVIKWGDYTPPEKKPRSPLQKGDVEEQRRRRKEKRDAKKPAPEEETRFNYDTGRYETRRIN